LLALIFLSGCIPRYGFDVRVLSAEVSSVGLEEEWITQQRMSQPYIVVEFRPDPEFAIAANQSADLLACNTTRDPLSGHPDPALRGHGLISAVRDDVFRAVFIREDIERFMTVTEGNGKPRVALKASFQANGLCFRARIPQVMHYGVTREVRIDEMLRPSSR
jgi:hypothetical protein